MVLLPSTYVNCLSPVKYCYKNNRQRVVKVYEFFLKIGTQAPIDIKITLVKFHKLLRPGSEDMRGFDTDYRLRITATS